MFSKIYVFTYVVLCGYVESLHFDQRQNGDLNVQVDLKDVQIFAVLTGEKEEYVDYDYAYDYSQLTIKPQNRTTPKPFNSSSTSTPSENFIDTTTAANTVSYEHPNSTTLEINNTAELDNTGIVSIPETNSTTNIKIVTENVTQEPPLVVNSTKRNITLATNSSAENPIICRKGFVVNNKECQPRVNSTENALMKLVKLSQKLKLRRENNSNNN